MWRKLRRLSLFLLRLALVCLTLSLVVFLVTTPRDLLPKDQRVWLLYCTVCVCVWLGGWDQPVGGVTEGGLRRRMVRVVIGSGEATSKEGVLMARVAE